jgi:hypothetical protein
MKKFIIRIFPLVLFILLPLNAQTQFSTDSALSYLKTISVTIGARPMGSPNERRAMKFALDKFREFGLTETTIMELSTAEDEMMHASINTKSGVVVGVLRGTTNRMIVLGGHIDSAGPDIPGANDDGSGAASVIELARVLSKEQLQSTIVFCLFGGEEAGLIGSKYFVQQFPRLDSIALMLELDMANGTGWLIPTIDCKTGNTPIWLVKAAYEEYEKLGYTGLSYPTHFFALLSAFPGGGVGSDHEPFLKKNIPAIDFTSDASDPMHTPQDDINHFKPSGLKQSGDLALALVHRFDHGVPEEKTNTYYLFQIGKYLFFFPMWALSVFSAFSILLALSVLFFVRKRRTEQIHGQRPVIPALKLFLIAIVIQTFVWLSENVVGLLKGVRFPWIAHPDGYLVLGFLAALFSIGLLLQLTPRIHLSHDPYRWFLRAVVFLLLFIFLCSCLNAKWAFYPATALFFLSLAMIARRPWLKAFLWILSPHFMFRLMFSELFVFLARTMALHSIQPMWMYAALHVFYILFFALWSFPFLLGFAAMYFDSGIDLLWLKQWRTRRGILSLCTVCVVCVIILLFLPSYSEEWRQSIAINQSWNINTGKGTLVLNSSEYLNHLRVHLADKDTNISTWDRECLLKEFTVDRTPWITIEHTNSISSDSTTTFDILAKIHFKYRPLNFTLTYNAGINRMENVTSADIANITDHSVSMQWGSFPDTVMMIPIHFRVVKSDSVTETVKAVFMEMIEPVRIEKELTNIVPRTTIQCSEVIRAH